MRRRLFSNMSPTSRGNWRATPRLSAVTSSSEPGNAGRRDVNAATGEGRTKGAGGVVEAFMGFPVQAAARTLRGGATRCQRLKN
jgi:hypothetical protein